MVVTSEALTVIRYKTVLTNTSVQ